MFLAFAFVTLPFVVRTVQPVLEELEPDVEEAAASLGASRLTTFRRIILPSLVPGDRCRRGAVVRPGISEYGSLVLLSGNLPNRTEVASVRILTYIENGDPTAAAAVATLMLLVVALARDRRARRHPAEGGPPWLSTRACASRQPRPVRRLRVDRDRLRLHAGRLAGRRSSRSTPSPTA